MGWGPSPWAGVRGEARARGGRGLPGQGIRAAGIGAVSEEIHEKQLFMNKYTYVNHGISR